jgi:type II secretory pathway component PulL
MTAEAVLVATVDDNSETANALVETTAVEETTSGDQQAIALAVRAAQYSRLEELREVINYYFA